ncbi:hypothetical protein [Cloacibacillus porcorum]|uniref:hypothetical protein n=1 Tax=Cloacibacillus porcorum TaxID=1197717 RepID=UPI002672D99D|nr:hypothetical protein [Cloacibacillus porcorum]
MAAISRYIYLAADGEPRYPAVDANVAEESNVGFLDRRRYLVAADGMARAVEGAAVIWLSNTILSTIVTVADGRPFLRRPVR